MRKYLFIFKSELMSNLQYVFDFFVSFFGYFIMLFILFSLWKYVYSDPNELINGYSMSQMTWYVIITEILWMTLGGRKLCAKICDEVRGGNIAYNINKPYSYIGYSLASHFGFIAIKGVMFSLFGFIVGLIFLGEIPSISFLGIIAFFITGVLATAISILLITFIGLFSFIIEDATPFYWLYSKFILVIGTIFPIEYFPAFIQPILKFSPIYVVSYGPAKLFVDFSWKSFVSVVSAQIIYLLISYLLCSLIYKKGVKRLNVNGG